MFHNSLCISYILAVPKTPATNICKFEMSIEHQKHTFKLIDKQMITILCINLLYGPLVNKLIRKQINIYRQNYALVYAMVCYFGFTKPEVSKM